MLRYYGAVQVMTGESVEDMNPPKLYETGRPQGYVGCKAPMFSFTRLRYLRKLVEATRVVKNSVSFRFISFEGA